MVQKFEPDLAKVYDDRIARLVPGYAPFHELFPLRVQADMKRPLQRFLVVGCGTGTELITLADHFTGCQFVGLEPAQDMADIAVRKIHEAGLEDRVIIERCFLEAYENHEEFDAVACILVSHFIPDNGAKERFFERLCRTAKIDAPLYLFDMTDTQDPRDREAYKAWAAQFRNASKLAKMFDNIDANFHPITHARLSTILAQNKWSSPHIFFQVLEYKATVTYRLDQEKSESERV